MRAVVRWVVVVVIGTIGLLPATVLAQETDDEETIQVRSRTTVKVEKSRLLGRVSAPFTPEGDDAETQDCEQNREVDVQVKTKRGFRPVGDDETRADGTWSIRAGSTADIYRIRVTRSEFAYSPDYGEVVQVRCLPVTVVGRRGPHGFRILSDQVLGLRFGRGEGGRLAKTGLPVEIYGAFGFALVLAGAVLVLKGERAGP